MIIKIYYVRNYCNLWIYIVQHPATSSLVVQGFINKPMSRRILVIYFWLLLFIINQFFGNLHLVLIFINWHSPLFFIVFRSFIKKPRMTDSKYFSTTRKGKPKFWYVQFLLFHHSFISKYETAYVCLHTEVKKRTNKKKSHR